MISVTCRGLLSKDFEAFWRNLVEESAGEAN